MKLPSIAIICTFIALAPAAAHAVTAGPDGSAQDHADCTGIQDQPVTPVLFHRCLTRDTHQAPAAAADPQPAPAPYPDPGLADAPLRLIDLKPVQFASNQVDLSDDAKQMLSRAARYLQQQSGLRRVLVIGYADHSGSRSHNYNLSLQRTKAVQAYLVAQGIAPGLLHGMARGSRMPVDESWIAAGRERNRRVELYAIVR